MKIIDYIAYRSGVTAESVARVLGMIHSFSYNNEIGIEKMFEPDGSCFYLEQDVVYYKIGIAVDACLLTVTPDDGRPVKTIVTAPEDMKGSALVEYTKPIAQAMYPGEGTARLIKLETLDTDPNEAHDRLEELIIENEAWG